MKLRATKFLRSFYWRLSRNRADAFHMLAVVPSFFWNAICLVWRIKLWSVTEPTVAIALLEHMGDIVAAEPIARLARQHFRCSRIFWITRHPYVSLPGSYPEIDCVVAVHCLTEWLLLQRLKIFDVVWDLHVDGRACPRCAIPQNKPDIRPNVHNYFDFGTLLAVQCLSAGLPKLDEGPSVFPPKAVVEAVNDLNLPARFIVIHCKSSDLGKDWIEDHWHSLVDRILEEDTVSIVEVGLAPQVIHRDTEGKRSLCGKLTILESAEVIRRAELFIGVDSGPAHLANAVGTPGVILLGNYRAFRSYMPYDGSYATAAKADLIRADGPVSDLALQAVLTPVIKRLTRDNAKNGEL